MDRLTRRTDGGKIVLNRNSFPEYAEETLQREVSAFPPFMRVMEKLYEYEERHNASEKSL